MTDARLLRISGTLVEAAPLREASLHELAYVGTGGLLGEVIRLDGDRATLQVYENTTGLQHGEPVVLAGGPMVLQLGPGLLGSILDGVGRPLVELASQAGPYIRPGCRPPTLDPLRSWMFTPSTAPGTRVSGGDRIGTVEERPGFAHAILVPPGLDGVIAELAAGAYRVDQEIGRLVDGRPLRLSHEWPIRTPRPSLGRLDAGRPFLTGQRVLDLFFPVCEGGSVAVPGGFGTGKTVIEQSLAKHAEADVVVFIGCGERGNEMAEVLGEFPRLTDPRTGRALMDRMVLIANTSNMPVAAREASIYMGLTIAEYYRDMGLRVAVMSDSLSRWAEALREIAARLHEMPGEEGYPTYLASRLGSLYERAGCVRANGSPPRTGAVTFISAISPPGGDLSEPVTQASLRVAGALWALDPTLAQQRQFPAVDWETSYSLYVETTMPWFASEVASDWPRMRQDLLSLLQQESELREISGLVGTEALQDRDRLLIQTARIVRETVLAQSVYDPNDARSSILKTWKLGSLARMLHETAAAALEAGVPLESLDLAPPRRALMALRGSPDDAVEQRSREAAAAIAALSSIAAPAPDSASAPLSGEAGP